MIKLIKTKDMKKLVDALYDEVQRQIKQASTDDEKFFIETVYSDVTDIKRWISDIEKSHEKEEG
jgi:gas vesicle protein